MVSKLCCAERQMRCGRKAPTCDEEAGRGRRMGAEKIVRYWLDRRREVSRMSRTETLGLYHSPVGRRSDTRSQKGWGNREHKAKTSKIDWK